MTRDEIVAEIKRYGFGSEVDYSDAVIAAEVNIVNGEILNAAPNWPFAEVTPVSTNVTIASGSNTAALPTSPLFSKARALVVGSAKLTYIEPDEFIALSAGGATGAPTTYTIHGGTLLFYPTPTANGTGKLWYQKELSDLSSGSTVPVIPARYHYLYVDGVLARLFEGGHDDSEGRQAAEARYQALLGQMKADLLQKELDRTEALTATYALSNIMKEVRDHGFPDLGNSILTLWANAVVGEISASEFFWPWQETGPSDLAVTAANPVVTLPTDCAKPKKIMTSDRVVVRESVEAVWDPDDGAGVGVLDTNGNPSYYSMWGTSATGVPKIRLFPTPTASETWKIWYIKTPAALAALTDTPPWPARHHRIVVLGLLVRACQMSTNPADTARCAVFQAEYSRALDIMRHDLLNPQVDNADLVESSAKYFELDN